jgi:hypothetical protein
VLFLESHGLLERVLVGAVQLVVQRLPSDVLAVRRDLELKIRIRNLLKTHDDVQGHGGCEEEQTLLQRCQ